MNAVIDLKDVVLEKTRKLTDGTTRVARYHILDNPD